MYTRVQWKLTRQLIRKRLKQYCYQLQNCNYANVPSASASKEKFVDVKIDLNKIRNIGIIAHIDAGKLEIYLILFLEHRKSVFLETKKLLEFFFKTLYNLTVSRRYARIQKGENLFRS